MDDDGGACDPTGTRMIKSLAMGKAETQLASRDVRTDVLYLLIAKFYALHPPDKPHTPRRKKQAVRDAMELYRVSERTVREAIRKCPPPYFTAAK